VKQKYVMQITEDFPGATQDHPAPEGCDDIAGIAGP
jgi:hypothetical protein